MAADEPLVRWDWVRDHTDDITEQFWEHVTLTAVAVGIGFVISMVLALVAVRWRWTYEPLAGVCSVLYAIPSLALFGILVSIPFFGLGFRTAEVALVSYTLLILLSNGVADLDGAPPAVPGRVDPPLGARLMVRLGEEPVDVVRRDRQMERQRHAAVGQLPGAGIGLPEGDVSLHLLGERQRRTAPGRVGRSP